MFLYFHINYTLFLLFSPRSLTRPVESLIFHKMSFTYVKWWYQLHKTWFILFSRIITFKFFSMILLLKNSKPSNIIFNPNFNMFQSIKTCNKCAVQTWAQPSDGLIYWRTGRNSCFPQYGFLILINEAKDYYSFIDRHMTMMIFLNIFVIKSLCIYT